MLFSLCLKVSFCSQTEATSLTEMDCRIGLIEMVSLGGSWNFTSPLDVHNHSCPLWDFISLISLDGSPLDVVNFLTVALPFSLKVILFRPVRVPAHRVPFSSTCTSSSMLEVRPWLVLICWMLLFFQVTTP